MRLVIYTNELKHFGIKGMKWGIRRTPEQLGHPSEEYPRSKKAISSMSDQELQSKINRLNREKQYKDLTKSPGRKFAEKVVFGLLAAVAFETAKELIKGEASAVAKKGANYIKDYFVNGPKIDVSSLSEQTLKTAFR